MVAAMGQPGPTWSSQRDQPLLAILYNTGARVTEIVRLRVVDVVLDRAACEHLQRKGRRQRSVPLRKRSGCGSSSRSIKSDASRSGRMSFFDTSVWGNCCIY
jgi:site-specific recombinase XerC